MQFTRSDQSTTWNHLRHHIGLLDKKASKSAPDISSSCNINLNNKSLAKIYVDRETVWKVLSTKNKALRQVWLSHTIVLDTQLEDFRHREGIMQSLLLPDFVNRV